MKVRTRFAPSPTGFLHLGGARTALFCWAFAQHHQGTFILRIEDTDLERSTPEAVQAILDSMNWLGLQPDEGPFYQMQRIERYREILHMMLEQGKAYYCYSTVQEVQAMREKARERGLKPRYDGTWRPEVGKALPPIPLSASSPVIRFKNPLQGITRWDDLVKGPIQFDNTELDDLIIARSDGTPTYNFCVAVDDWDMGITHVIRGDDHVNNTPRQINILRALAADLPTYGHVPMILGPDGEKLSKRHHAVNLMDYALEGYLPEAMINYLARLGWGHGNDELFERKQLVAWFDGSHLSKSPSQWDAKKLNWVNAHYLKRMNDDQLAQLITPRIVKRGGQTQVVDLTEMVHFLKDRAETLEQLADDAMIFCETFKKAPADLAEQYLNKTNCAILRDFAESATCLEWTRENLQGLIKTVLVKHHLKMPEFGLPLRVALTGRLHTPALNTMLYLLGKQTVLDRLNKL